MIGLVSGSVRGPSRAPPSPGDQPGVHELRRVVVPLEVPTASAAATLADCRPETTRVSARPVVRSAGRTLRDEGHAHVGADAGGGARPSSRVDGGRGAVASSSDQGPVLSPPAPWTASTRVRILRLVVAPEARWMCRPARVNRRSARRGTGPLSLMIAADPAGCRCRRWTTVSVLGCRGRVTAPDEGVVPVKASTWALRLGVTLGR
jgi:hypothetical protein